MQFGSSKSKTIALCLFLFDFLRSIFLPILSSEMIEDVERWGDEEEDELWETEDKQVDRKDLDVLRLLPFWYKLPTLSGMDSFVLFPDNSASLHDSWDWKWTWKNLWYQEKHANKISLDFNNCEITLSSIYLLTYSTSKISK